MNDEITNIPKIRFKGYTEDWEQRKLGDDIKLVGGATPYKGNPEYWNGDIVWLSSQEIKGKYVDKGTFTITNKAIEDNTTRMVKAETPLIVTRSGILNRFFPISLPTKDVAINQDIKALQFDREIINTDFIYAQIQGQSDFILRTIVKTGTTVQSVNIPDFVKLYMYYPSYKEQEKIGTFFKQLDDTIALHQRELDLLRKTKQTYLQKMFPKTGEDKPEIRFAGYTDAWEQRRLRDVITERNIQQPQSKEYPLVSFTVENGVTPKTDRYEREQLVIGDKESKKYKITELDDIVYNPANLKFGAISRNRYGKAVFSPIYVTFIVEKQVAFPTFVEMFVTRKDFIQSSLKYQQGTVYERKSVSPEDLLSMPMLLPTKDEQTKIGIFFQQLDDIITLHQRNLNVLKEMKKSLLRQMFV